MYQFILRINLLKHYQLLVICFLSTMLLSACGSSDSSVVLATPVENYTISTLADSNGTITASSSVESGETVIVTIMPDSDFVVSDVLIDGVSVGPVQFYEFTNVDADHTVDATFAVENIDNIMPAGIPAPSFGIHETHLMYADQFYDAGGFEYLDAGNGPYSHYIDNTDPDASDEDNPYGTQTKPRVTIPDFVPEASVVEIHGGPYTHTRINSLRLDGVGTIEKPIFYRGTSNDSLVHIDVTAQSGYRNSAQFIIIENLRLHKYNINPSETTTVSHIALRYSEVTGDASSGGVGVASWVTDNWISDIVLYNLHIHDNGPWDTTEGDPDIHGIGIGVYVRHMWILDNKLYHNAGNAIQLIGAGPSGNNSLVHHIYMGRNYDNGKPNLQQFIGIKGSSDVIISENHVSTQGGYRTNGAMSFQYGPERIWFLFNKIHDVNGGIGSGSNSVPDPGKESYVIGNLIYNIKQKDYTDWNPNNPWSNAAIKLWGGGKPIYHRQYYSQC
ncbi:MAG: hypothetical protein GY787_11845 [Alteromonadales bacterium]|nr:hypothetical protein [Alteromonadales bacterium]